MRRAGCQRVVEVEDGHRVIRQKTVQSRLKEITTMTADPNSIELSEVLETNLQRAEPDLLHSMLTT